MWTRRFNLDDGARFAGPPLAARENGDVAPSLNSMPRATRHGSAQRKFIAVTWLLLVGELVMVIVAEVSGLTGAGSGIGIALVLLGVVGGGHETKRITAGRMYRSGTGITIFTLSLDEEEVALEP